MNSPEKPQETTNPSNTTEENHNKYVSEFAPSQKEPPTPANEPQNNAEGKIVSQETTSNNDIEYASFVRRFFAELLDAIIFYVGIGIILFPLALLLNNNNSTIFAIFESLLRIIAYLAYYIYFIGSRGQTPGKMALGVKVVIVGTSSPPGYVNAFLREIVGKFLSSLVLCLGYFWMLWDDKKQTWHDKIANTIVIRT